MEKAYKSLISIYFSHGNVMIFVFIAFVKSHFTCSLEQWQLQNMSRSYQELHNPNNNDPLSLVVNTEMGDPNHFYDMSRNKDGTHKGIRIKNPTRLKNHMDAQKMPIRCTSFLRWMVISVISKYKIDTFIYEWTDLDYDFFREKRRYEMGWMGWQSPEMEPINYTL